MDNSDSFLWLVLNDRDALAIDDHGREVAVTDIGIFEQKIPRWWRYKRRGIGEVQYLLF
jgi:hypothetical protein